MVNFDGAISLGSTFQVLSLQDISRVFHFQSTSPSKFKSEIVQGDVRDKGRLSA